MIGMLETSIHFFNKNVFKYYDSLQALFGKIDLGI